MHTQRCWGQRGLYGLAAAGQLARELAACGLQLHRVCCLPSRAASMAALLGPTGRTAWPSQLRRNTVQPVRAVVEAWPSLQQRSRSQYIYRLNAEHSIEGFVEFYQSAAGGLPVCYLMHPRGHTLEIHLQGATITRWLQPDGTDLLFMRSDAEVEAGAPINSGIPIAFPQWRDGGLPYNGFADKLLWEVVGTDLDGEFVNQLFSREDFQEGRVQVAFDEQGRSLAPLPANIINEEDDWEEYDDLMAAGVGQDVNAMFNEAEAEAPISIKKKRAGRKKKGEAGKAEAADAATPDPTAADYSAEAAAGAGSGSDSDGEAAAVEGEAGVSSSAEEQEWDEEEQEADDLELDYGVIEDPAPYIILKLRDTPETRAIWPHKFVLYYKISLMESDDFPDPKDGMPKGIHPWTGSDLPLHPRDDALTEALDDPDLSEEAAAAMMAAAAQNSPPPDLEECKGGQKSYTGYRMYTDEDGMVMPDEIDDDGMMLQDIDLDDSNSVDNDSDNSAAGGEGGAEEGSDGRKKVRKRKAAEGAESDQEEGEDDALPRDIYDPAKEPMQIKMEWVLINKDYKGSPPFSFQLGALSHFRTKDQMKYGDFVRVLGLGGVPTFDWSEDPRRAKLLGNEEDYIVFDGERREAVYIGSHDADVMFCPGSRTHFELMARQGLPDHVVWHPGALGLPGLEVEPRFFAQVGAGRLALPKKLAPGEMWRGEYVIRHHNKYWDPPIFDRDGPQPMPQLYPKADDADDDDGLDDGEGIEGISSSKLGGGPDVPYNDE